LKLEIGGGHLLTEGYVNLDYRHGDGEWRRLAQDTPWPTPDQSVEAMRASHIMEHIPAGQNRIDVMNEAWRVLVPGGQFEIIVPLMTGSWHAIADPTHVSYWVEESFYYFCEGNFHPNADYGIKLWQTIDFHVEQGFEGHWTGSPLK
jgi:hypothetical protein